jgi:predicted AAA+ superfamily ATPase
LDHVHRLIENRRLQFILTGSSARKLRRGGVNLLAGRAITKRMHPLSIVELGDDYDWQENLKTGFLPYVFSDIDKQAYLKSYISTYLKEEVQQEGLTRNLASFSRFIEAASFSQGSTLNISAVARDCSVDRKMVETYFDILEDLLIAVRIPVFTRKAKRRLVAHPKFYYFDCGVFQAIRPKGPLDEPSEIGGAALETLVLQQLRAQNDNQNLGYDFYYWRTSSGTEVDFVLYGPKGLLAFEVKLRSKVRKNDLKSLKTFLEDYPVAKAHLLYGGNEYLEEIGIKIIPISQMGKHSIL